MNRLGNQHFCQNLKLFQDRSVSLSVLLLYISVKAISCKVHISGAKSKLSFFFRRSDLVVVILKSLWFYAWIIFMQGT